MRNVLADLCVESEAATIAALRLARSYDDSIAGDEQAEAFKRIAESGPQVLDLQARAVSCRRSASSAWAATATSRTRRCPASTGRLPSTRSGRARATSSASTSCARWPRRRPRSTPSSPRSRRPRAIHALIPTSSSLRSDLADMTDIEARARSLVERMALALQGSLLAALRRSGRRRRLLLEPPRRRPGERIRHPAERHRLHPHHRASPCSVGLGARGDQRHAGERDDDARALRGRQPFAQHEPREQHRDR